MLKIMHEIADIFILIIADYLVVPVVLLGAWAMLWQPREQRIENIGRGIVAGLAALFIAKILSLLYQGERPFVAQGVEAKAAYLNNPGFPSDHVLFVFTITFVVWATTRNSRLTAVLVVMSLLVAAGRVLALVHTPLDVVGGFAAALLGVSLVYGRDFYRRRRLPR
jgi:membrane-associated phospholipid phosphatase